MWKLIGFLAVVALAFGQCVGVSERDALVAIYNSTGGLTWNANNWEPLNPASDYCQWT
ncbi:hypothetical protein KIPB_007086, partial [Kipferlia bialata]|eukprot:g7086.t1